MITVIAALIGNEKGEILITQRNKNKTLGGYWEFPGGKREENEDDEACLKREIYEELNVSIEVLNHFYDSQYDYPFGTVLLKVYLAKIIGGKMILHEHEESRWCPIDSMKKYEKFTPADIAVLEEIDKRKNELMNCFKWAV